MRFAALCSPPDRTICRGVEDLQLCGSSKQGERYAQELAWIDPAEAESSTCINTHSQLAKADHTITQTVGNFLEPRNLPQISFS